VGNRNSLIKGGAHCAEAANALGISRRNPMPRPVAARPGFTKLNKERFYFKWALTTLS
jgi:hypothetical protein